MYFGRLAVIIAIAAVCLVGFSTSSIAQSRYLLSAAETAAGSDGATGGGSCKEGADTPCRRAINEHVRLLGEVPQLLLKQKRARRAYLSTVKTIALHRVIADAYATKIKAQIKEFNKLFKHPPNLPGIPATAVLPSAKLRAYLDKMSKLVEAKKELDEAKDSPSSDGTFANTVKEKEGALYNALDPAFKAARALAVYKKEAEATKENIKKIIKALQTFEKSIDPAVMSFVNSGLDAFETGLLEKPKADNNEKPVLTALERHNAWKAAGDKVTAKRREAAAKKEEAIALGANDPADFPKEAEEPPDPPGGTLVIMSAWYGTLKAVNRYIHMPPPESTKPSDACDAIESVSWACEHANFSICANLKTQKTKPMKPGEECDSGWIKVDEGHTPLRRNTCAIAVKWNELCRHNRNPSPYGDRFLKVRYKCGSRESVDTKPWLDTKVLFITCKS